MVISGLNFRTHPDIRSIEHSDEGSGELRNFKIQWCKSPTPVAHHIEDKGVGTDGNWQTDQ
jgi:hypothetical protein